MRFGRIAVALGVGALLAGLASAQQPGGRGGFGGGFGGGGLTAMIAQNKSLQDELKVDKDQVEKITEALAKVREDLKDEMAKLRDFNTPAEDRQDIMKKLGEANAKAVESVLKPEQVKRLHQIENQRAGIGMYAKEDVQKALKLSDSQKEKIKGIQDDLRKDMGELFPGPGGRGGPGGGGGGRGGFGGPNAETQKKIQALQKEATDNIAKVLDDNQKKAAKDLTGEPFELRFEGFAAGGGGFGGPGGGPGGGFGGPPQPGQLLSPFIQNQLKLTDDQKKQLEGLQKDVEEKLGKILTDDQKKQLKDMQENAGRGGFGGGRRGPGGP